MAAAMNERELLERFAPVLRYDSQGSFFAMTEEHWDRAFDNKLRGTVRCIRHAVPPMRERMVTVTQASAEAVGAARPLPPKRSSCPMPATSTQVRSRQPGTAG